MHNRLYPFGKFQLTTGSRELRRAGERVQLPRRAFDCLLYLIEHRDRAVGRDELTAAVWGRVDVTDAQLSQVMLQARRAIDDSGQAQSAIRTLPGFGYHWIAEIGERPDDVYQGEPAATAAAVVQPESGAYATVEEDLGAVPIDIAASTSPPPSPARASTRLRWLFAAASILMLLVIALAATTRIGRRVQVTDPIAVSSALAVLPLEVRGPSDSGWVRLGAMDLIAERLRSAGLPVPPSENVLIALRSAPVGDRGTHELGGNLGVGTLVEGKAIQSSEGWTIELAAARGESQHYTATAKHADVIRAARQAADLLLAAMGHAPPPERGESNDLDERLQQVQAAILAGELDTADKILAALPEQDAPRVRLMQAQVEAQSGKLAQAETRLTELIADAVVQADSLLYGRALTSRGTVHYRRTEFTAAERDYAAAVAALQNANAPVDLGRALNRLGLVRVSLDRYDEAAADLGRARLELQRTGDRLGLIQSDMNFGLLEAQRDRLEQSLPYLLGAADQFEAVGAVERMLAVLINAFDAKAALLRWTDALAIAERQWAQRDRADDPTLRLYIAVNRGKALAALGRLREAQELAETAERELGDARDPARRRLYALQAEIAWARGQSGQALVAAERSLALWPSDYPIDDLRALVVLRRQRVLITSGEATTEKFEPSPTPAAGEISPILRAAHAEADAWQGHFADAERSFRAAQAKAEEQGVPAVLATVAEAYGRWLLAQHRIDEAAALAGRLAPWADRDFDVAVFQVAVFQARGDHSAAAIALRQARTLAGERELSIELQAVASK